LKYLKFFTCKHSLPATILHLTGSCPKNANKGIYKVQQVIDKRKNRCSFLIIRWTDTGMLVPLFSCLWIKCFRIYEAFIVRHFICRLSWNLGASTSWNPQGLSRRV